MLSTSKHITPDALSIAVNIVVDKLIEQGKLVLKIECVLNEEEEPTRCYLVFYYTYERLNMFWAAICPSSGAHDYISGSSSSFITMMHGPIHIKQSVCVFVYSCFI
jgi:hypothetical protein